ncbi:hypothetical protein AB6C83_13125 [Vibrio cyclitrophicus]
MEVINISDSDFLRLYHKVFSDISEPDLEDILIVGIAHGGLPLMDGLIEYLLNNKIVVDKAQVVCQRPSTALKKENHILSFMFNATLKSLPYLVLDKMRVFEHKRLSKRSAGQVKRTVKWKVKPKKNEYKKIIIIDDAIDSGYSFKLVDEFVKHNLSFGSLYSTVAVVTQKEPLYKPTFTLFSDVLIRFPWSSDAKK